MCLLTAGLQLYLYSNPQTHVARETFPKHTFMWVFWLQNYVIIISASPLKKKSYFFPVPHHQDKVVNSKKKSTLGKNSIKMSLPNHSFFSNFFLLFFSCMRALESNWITQLISFVIQWNKKNIQNFYLLYRERLTFIWVRECRRYSCMVDIVL